MNESERPRTLDEIFGFDKGDSQYAQVSRIYGKLLDLNVGDRYFVLAPPDRYFWAVYWLIYEVDNGGVDQFFFNRGVYAKETLEALQAIGAEASYERILAGCALFPNGQPSEDQQTCQDQLRAIHGRSEGKHIDDIARGQLDDNLEELLLAYRRNQGIAPDAICPVPSDIAANDPQPSRPVAQ